ncbi:MAG TPA: Type 1 glutamine amidotransferase-like domain-containing protein [Microthrixaceae bacterium]|nr:Type 1 glutamine amidotransferase-like domain-containing protein [Microthrixaceae bacterium]HPB44601.1 Type 1 glutamine amidotransferase-like domain-containing protein [Microthrixaceae bacterium]
MTKEVEMSGILALVGGAEWTDGCTFDAKLLQASGTDRVVLIPTAAAYERPQDTIDAATRHFAKYGVTVDVVEVYRRADALAPGAADVLKDAKFVYIAGGSPMHLRSVLKSSPVWDAIVEVWKRGGIIAGTAEGASVLSTFMVDSRGGAYTVGLDFLDGLTVIPRFNTWSEDKLHRTITLAPTGMDIVGIDEATALIWDGAWRVEGSGAVTAFENGKRIEPDQLDPLSTTV